jgi:small subunit ribosomal protein S3Ae
MHIKLKFKITSVEGYDAKTSFTGHELTSDYVRRLTRRKKTKTDHVIDINTVDGFVIRVKPMSIAERRIQSSQEEGMRKVMYDTLIDMGRGKSLSEIVKAIVSGDMARDLARACRVVIPVKRIESARARSCLRRGRPESIIGRRARGGTREEDLEEPAEDQAEAEEAEAEESSE